ncbi:MAG: crotonase/enoyl-CoA hydratase family protein [Parvibaculaceae bacterium]
MQTRAQDYQDIRYEVIDGRARISLARPQTHNAMTQRMLEELERALWDADDNIEVHCVVLRGEGPSFCSGYDLTALGGSKRPGYRTGRSHDDDIWLIERNNRRIRALWDIHKPCIAQVHGNCLAGGADLAMACDMVIVADDARIGFPAARAMGALPNNLWMYHCGPQWAKRLQLTGDCVTGADAEKIGLVLKAVPAAALEDEVEGLADRLSLIDSDLLAANKRISNLALELMGAQTLQRLAAENDARAHRSQAVRDYGRSVKENGLKETLRSRDKPFGDGIARVGAPEGRDPIVWAEMKRRRLSDDSE